MLPVVTESLKLDPLSNIIISKDINLFNLVNFDYERCADAWIHSILCLACATSSVCSQSMNDSLEYAITMYIICIK